MTLQKTPKEEEHEEKDDPGVEADVRKKNESQIIYQDIAEVLKYLASQVVLDEQFYLGLRRGANLTRIIQLWQREKIRKSALNRVTLKYLGEDGIDSGAIAKEFLLM